MIESMDHHSMEMFWIPLAKAVAIVGAIVVAELGLLFAIYGKPQRQ